VACGSNKSIVPMPIIAANDTGKSRNGFDNSDLLSREEKFMHSIY